MKSSLIQSKSIYLYKRLTVSAFLCSFLVGVVLSYFPSQSRAAEGFFEIKSEYVIPEVYRASKSIGNFSTLFTQCSIGKVYDLLVTAKHCIASPPYISKDMDATFEIENKRIKIKVQYHPKTIHYLPYDIVVLEPDPKDKDIFDKIPNVEISNSHPNNGDSVFAIGFPNVTANNRLNKNSIYYDYSEYQKRVTYGEVVDANLEQKSFCKYNNILSNNPESWVLEDNCNYMDYTKLKRGVDAREEKNTILTNTDMIGGMSGSFLFTMDGKLIGIGSTIKSSKSGNYQENAGIYSKASNILEILNP